jgi:hypothetical protein
MFGITAAPRCVEEHSIVVAKRPDRFALPISGVLERRLDGSALSGVRDLLRSADIQTDVILSAAFPKYGCEFFRTLTGRLRPGWRTSSLVGQASCPLFDRQDACPTKAFHGTPSRKVTAEGTQCVTDLTKWST